MARVNQCDCCGKQVIDGAVELAEWSVFTLAKLSYPTVHFQKEELCEACTANLRRVIQKPLIEGLL